MDVFKIKQPLGPARHVLKIKLFFAVRQIEINWGY